MRQLLAFLFLFSFYYSLPAAAQETIKESVYDRVMRTGEIRCSYVIYPPLLDRDINTGTFSGLNYEIMEEVGKQLNLKISWVEEVGTDNAFTGLDSGRYDANCVAFWEIPARARAGIFSEPLYYEGLYAFARTDDTRFDSGPQTINSPDVSVVVLEGEMSQFIARDDFPMAKVITQPGLTGAAVRFMDVAAKKADVTFNEMTVYNNFNKENPGQIKLLYQEPLRVNYGAFSVAKGEHDLLQMLNSAIRYMHNTGATQRILDKYDPDGKIYLPVAKGYDVKK